MTDHLVYRAFDSDETVLYVGMTNNFTLRSLSHKVRSPWTLYVARFERDEGLTFDQALAWEKELIFELKPLFNRTPAKVPMLRAQRYMEERGDGDLFLHPSRSRYLSTEMYRQGGQGLEKLLSQMNRDLRKRAAQAFLDRKAEGRRLDAEADRRTA